MNSDQEKRKEIIHGLMDKMTYEQREKMFSQLLIIDGKNFYEKAMVRSFAMDEAGEVQHGEFSYEKAFSMFGTSTKDISVLLNPIIDAVLRENADEYKEVYDHIDSLVQILAKAFAKMFAAPLFKDTLKSKAAVSMEEANNIRSIKCFTLSLDEMRERVNKANELRNFDMSKFKK